MRPMVTLTVMTLLAASVLVEAHGGDLHMADTKTLGASGTATAMEEVNLDREAGEHLAYTWNSTAPVSFDVHYHDAGDTVQYLAGPQTASEGSGTVDVPAGGSLSFFWQNQGSSDVTLNYTINTASDEGSDEGDGHDDDGGPAAIPGAGAIAGLAVLGLMALVRRR